MLDAIIKTLPLINCYHECVHNAEVRQGNDPFTESRLKQCSSLLPKRHAETKRKVKAFGFGSKRRMCMCGVYVCARVCSS